MYERSASVLEKYFEKKFGFNKENNLKNNYQSYEQVIKDINEYQDILKEEEKEITKFDEVATEIQDIQKKQAKLNETNIELEKQRNQLFNDLEENPNTLEKKLQKIEENIYKNNESLKELREKYITSLGCFIERQKERNKYTKTRRTTEAKYLTTVKKATEIFENINLEEVQKLKAEFESTLENEQKELIDIMIKNGKNEKISFFELAIEQAVKVRTEIAKREAEIYIGIYIKTKKILSEIENDNVKISKYEKILKDSIVKLNFLRAEKEYIAGFLDNERMVAFSGKKSHEETMKKACSDFELDIAQINNLYELVIKEAAGKATKKIYNELYNKNYLKEIQEKELDFKQEANTVKLNMGTVINFNYWRIEGIKNIYNVFLDEISKNFNKDLSEYKIEEIKIEEKVLEKKADKVEENKKEKKTIKNKIKEEKFFEEADNFFEEDDEEDDEDEIEETEEYDEDNFFEDDEEIEDEIDEDEMDDDEFDEEDFDEEDFDEEDFEEEDFDEEDFEEDDFEEDDFEEEDFEEEDFEEDDFEEEDFEEDDFDEEDFEDEIEVDELENRLDKVIKQSKKIQNNINKEKEEKKEKQLKTKNTKEKKIEKEEKGLFDKLLKKNNNTKQSKKGKK